MKTESQNKKVLAHLQEGKAITSLGAINRFMITRLSARIRNLKDDGHDIKSVTVHDPKDRRKHYSVYCMDHSMWYQQHQRKS